MRLSAQGTTTTLANSLLVKDLKSGTTLAGSSYEYDALGRITKATDTKTNAYTTYAYDTQGFPPRCTMPGERSRKPTPIHTTR